MATARKLKKDIENCYKKVDEGVREFNEVWDKLQSSSNSNQKEKKEEELKKCIKKLQRLRDQIKAWQASKATNDEAQLIEYRHIIERQMERFKVVERETKTKPYSREGLVGPVTKDPAQKEKDECNKWMQDSLDALSRHIEQNEAEIECLENKKRLSKSDQDQRADLQCKLDRHNLYTKNIETLMRLLYNDKIGAVEINNIREDVEYYVENYEDDENLYLDDAVIFDDFEFDEEFVPEMAKTDEYQSNNVHESSSTKSDEKEEESPSSPMSKRDRKLSENSEKSERTRHKSSGASDRPPSASDSLKEENLSPRKPSKSSVSSAAFPGTPAQTPKQPTHPNQVTNMANLLRKNNVSERLSESPNNTSAWPSNQSGTSNQNSSVLDINKLDINDDEEEQRTSPLSENVFTPVMPQREPIANHQYTQDSQHSNGQNGEVHNNVSLNSSDNIPSENNVSRSSSDMLFKECTLVDLISPVQVSPEAQREFDNQRAQVEAAYRHMPQLSDSEKPRQYLPRYPVETPKFYPNRCIDEMHTPEFFLKLSVETLFYIFYYMEGTRAQYLAAVTLKKQSWRFHTKYMMWFQRHEEPKQINEEFEQGTYIYFDYERWAQRRKDGFTFEYRYLEDRDLPIN